jgi:hypothetical protein
MHRATRSDGSGPLDAMTPDSVKDDKLVRVTGTTYPSEEGNDRKCGYDVSSIRAR